MRPYLILMAVVLASVAAFGQQPGYRPYGPYGPCFYGCGASIPLLVTPQISLQQFSPNPVGASNATTGLIAGATNSTLSQVQGSTSSVYTVAVWYQGGAPMMTPAVQLWPQTIGREGHVMHAPMPGPLPAEHVSEVREIRTREAREERSREEHVSRQSEEPRRDWTYIAGPKRAATHVFTNDDVIRQNDKNGTVKHDGKTEKM
jgi:hypothetical protein